MADKRIASKNRPQIIIMLVAFPLLVVFGTHSLVWLAERDTLLETTNRGAFVDPPLLARELGLRDAAGAVVDGSGVWWVWVATADCAAACERSLTAMRELRRRLRDHADPVRQALVTKPYADSLPPPGRYPETRHFISDSDKALEEGVYLVDPVGNVVLRYPLDTGHQPVLEDLARLLEVPEDG